MYLPTVNLGRQSLKEVVGRLPRETGALSPQTPARALTISLACLFYYHCQESVSTPINGTLGRFSRHAVSCFCSLSSSL